MRRFRSPRLLLAVIVAVVAVATGVGILLNSGSDTATDEVSAGTTPVTAPRAVEPSPPVASRSDLPDQKVDPPETGPERLVVVGGAVLTVPGGWSVFDIDAHPDAMPALQPWPGAICGNRPTANIENTGPELCEVVLDDLDAAVTDGSGHLLDVAGNPISTSAGAAALFPGVVELGE